MPPMVWKNNDWERGSGESAPMVSIKYKLAWDGYAVAGLKPPIQKVRSKQKGPLVATGKAMADTGCSTMVAGVDFMTNLGLRESDLVPTKSTVKAANKTKIEVLGALMVDIRLNTPGSEKSSKQVVFITRMTDKIYLSLSACKQLGLISKSFPHWTTEGVRVAEITDDSGMQVCNMAEKQDIMCACPIRTKPPPVPEDPNWLPFPEDRVDDLRKWIVDRYASSTFNTCPHQPLPKMKCEPVRIFVTENARPYAVHVPALIPVHFREEVKKQLDSDVRLGVIEKVPPNTPTTWCARMVIATKSDGSPRRTVDLQHLNMASVRQTHYTRSPYHLVMGIPEKTKKTVYDAWNGYHSVPIHEDDRHYTTFITEFGRYRYKVLPQGYLASGDGYTERYSEIVEGEPRKVQCIDDTCQFSKDTKESFHTTCRYLTHCGENGIILNPKKFQFSQDVVDFCGFEIGKDYIRPSSKFHAAISELTRPRTLSEVRSFFGLVEQIAYTFHSSTVMAPFRELLKPSNANENGTIYWDESLDKAFSAAKEAMLAAMQEGVRIYDMKRPTAVSTDWSVVGLGHTLKQKHCDCMPITTRCCKSGWKVVAFASRFCHPAESNYSPVEGEALSASAGLHKFRHFILGCENLSLEVDHKPLVKLLGDKKMDEIHNMRLLRLKEKTLPFKFTVIHRPGKSHTVPDYGSRNPTSPA